MKGKRFKNCFPKILALALAAAFLSGCASPGEFPEQIELSGSMPPALSSDINRESSFEAQLYFVSEDGRRLFPEARDIRCDGSMSRAEAAIRAMMDGPMSEVLKASVPSGLSFSGIELSRDACNVYFTGVLNEISDWLKLRAAVAATVYAAENIGTVNVYLNGMEPGYNGRALGALAPLTGALNTYLDDLEQRYRIRQPENTEAGSFETNTATLYFTNLDDTLLIARNRKITYDLTAGKSAVAAILIDELLRGDSGSKSLEPVLPADLQLLEEPTIVYLSDMEQANLLGANATPTSEPEEPMASPSPSPGPIAGGNALQDRDEECIIELVFQQPGMEFDQKMMCGAITLMLTGYLPKVKGVKISIAQTLENGSQAEQNLSENDYFVRDDFTDYIGHGIYLAFPDAEGAVLDRVERIVPSASVYDPDARLAQLFHGPADPGVMHPSFSEQDVLDVYIVNDLAVVNWKAGFAESLKFLAETEQVYAAGGRQVELFIFGVINTLTEIPGVERVWMLEDGKRLEVVESLYLGNALLRNPGILITEPSS